MEVLNYRSVRLRPQRLPGLHAEAPKRVKSADGGRSGVGREADIRRGGEVRKMPKPGISPEPLDVRAVRFSEPRRDTLGRLAVPLATSRVLGEQQRHQLIDRCRQVTAGRGATLLPLAKRAGGQS
jgi:hypothetical protein